MEDTDARAMKDRHSQDEARMRQSQQRSAGGEHSPVESYPQHGAQPGSLRKPADALVQDYERTLELERSAWEAVKAPAQESTFSADWEAWRTAVERRDKATRLLINHSLTEEGS